MVDRPRHQLDSRDVDSLGLALLCTSPVTCMRISTGTVNGRCITCTRWRTAGKDPVNGARLNVELVAVEDHLPGLLSARLARISREAQLHRSREIWIFRMRPLYLLKVAYPARQLRQSCNKSWPCKCYLSAQPWESST